MENQIFVTFDVSHGSESLSVSFIIEYLQRHGRTKCYKPLTDDAHLER